MNDTTTRGDVKISGTGTVATGTYRDVRISGSGTLTGDIDCQSFKVSGAVDGRGSLKAEQIGVSGSMKFDGDVDAGAIKVSGSASFGRAHVGELRVSGSVRFGGDLSGETIDVQGTVSVHGDCEAERFTGAGGFAVDGLLNAGVVDIRLHGASSAREIGGEAINVRFAPIPLQRLVAVFVPSYDPRLVVESIEGDDVHLEHTKARAVRGKRVFLGSGCEVDLVEYAETFERAGDARVKTARKAGDSGTTSESD